VVAVAVVIAVAGVVAVAGVEGAEERGREASQRIL
jgi:hypothetical protein